MMSIRASVLALVVILSSATAFAQRSTAPVEGLRSKNVRLVALTNCTAVPEPGQVLDSAVIVIRGERVVAVGRNLAVPGGATVVDLHGAWVYAGFVDPTMDVAALSASPKAGPADRPWWEDDDPVTPPAAGARHWNQAVRAEQRAAATVTVTPEASQRWTALGYTTAAVASHDGIFRGTAATTLLRKGTATTTVIADGAYHMASFRKGSSKTPYPSSQMGAIALIRQTLMDAVWYGKAHEAAKTSPQHTPPEVNLSLEALSGALAAGTPFVVELQDEHDALRWKHIADETPFPIVLRGCGKEYRRLEYFAAHRPTVILPLTLPDVPDVRDPAAAYHVPMTDLIHWYWAADNARLLDSVACPLAFTLDGVKNTNDMLTTLRTMVQRGLDSNTALAALTVRPAGLAGVADRCGRIAPGYYANIVITDGGLFSPSTGIRSVWVAGKENIVTPPADVDVRGHWTLTSSALPSNLRVTFTGTANRPTATAKRDSVVVPFDFVMSGSRATVRLTGDTLGIAGTLRGSVVADSIMMSGSITGPDGRTLPVVLRRDSALRTPRLAAAVPPSPTRRPLPTWRPLGPFGRDTTPTQGTVLLRNATVWTGTDGGRLEATDVLIAGGRIKAIGRDLGQAGSADRVIDCSGRHITAGIIDEHSHIAISRGVNEGTHAVTTEVRIGDVLDPDDINIYRQLAGGVTASHLLHGSANPMGGQLQFVKLRWGADADSLKVVGAVPTVKFALGENVKQSNWGDRYSVRYPQTRMGVEEIMRDAFRAAKEYEAQMAAVGGKAGIPVRRDLQLESLLEIVNGKRKIHCHSYVQSEILMLMRLAEEFGFQVHTFTHILEGYKVAREMSLHGASASTFADWWAYKFEVFDAIPENPAIMHEQKVLVSVNSDDAEMARRLNQEASKSVKYGDVGEEDALRFVTKNPATQMMVADRMGSLGVGMDADVVVWSGNPLSGRSRVEYTWVDGRLLFSRETDAALRDRDAALRRFLEQEAIKAISDGGTASARPSGPRRMYHCDDRDDEVAD